MRCRIGEVDLIAEHLGVLCFIEVRSTSSPAWGGPLATITPEKQRRLVRMARWYMAGLAATPHEIRFDAVGILWRAGQAPEITVVPSAFDATSSPGW